MSLRIPGGGWPCVVGTAALLCGPVGTPAQEGSDLQRLKTAEDRAQALAQEDKLAEAIRAYATAVSLSTRVHGAEHETTALLLHRLATLEQRNSQYTQAEPHFRRSLAILEGKLGKDHIQVAAVRNDLGDLCRVLGRHAEAESLCQRGLRVYEAREGKDGLGVAHCLNNLANLYKDMGQFPRAEPLIERCLRIRQSRLDKDHVQVALTLNDQAELYRLMGRYPEAEPLYQRSLRILEAREGKDHLEVAHVLNNLASLYWHLGQPAKAEPLFQRSLQIKEARLGKDHLDVAETVNNLAVVYWDRGDYARARSLLQRSLQIKETQLPPDHMEIAFALSNLAAVYRASGEAARAEPLLRRSLAIIERRLGRDHPDLVYHLNNLAKVYKDLGQYDRAEPLYLRALKLQETRLGPDHPDLVYILGNLALLYAAEGKWASAADQVDRDRRITRRHVGRILPARADNEQLDFLRNVDRNQFHLAQSLGLARRTDATMAARSASWVLNGKALAHEALAERAFLVRDSHDPVTARLSQDLARVRRELGSLILSESPPGQDPERRKQLAELTEREQELSKQLAQKAGRPVRADPWVSLEEVRRALPADAVLIDVSKFNQINFQARNDAGQWLGERYAAWVIPPAGRGEVRLIDLGEARAIEKNVQAVRVALADSFRAIGQDGEPEAERAVRKCLEPLARQVLQPVLAQAGDARQLLLSPDDSLWLVPWAALPIDAEHYAVERYTIRYLVSGRDLVRSPPPRPKDAEPPLILADPDFDLSPDRSRAEVRNLVAGAKSVAAELRSVSEGTRLAPVGRLPYTAAEGETIRPLLETYTGEKPRLYVREQALEEMAKACRSPRVVVLSTHAFFLGEPGAAGGGGGQGPAAETPVAVPAAEGRPPENPLLRCGLLLAGCNHRAALHKAGQEDGVLTGLEIVGCDLRGTELVVLSACDTGVGDVRNGEGVAGLRQAFQLAGARSVVATLWRVHDKETMLLVRLFFLNLGKGQARAEALRQAQLGRIAARRNRHGAAHPVFWAAFTLTGQ